MRIICILLSLLCNVPAWAEPAGIWNVRAYGAVADGIHLDTQAIQTAIDSCSASGGGKVLLAGGTFLSGTIYLKNNVTLYIENGTVLLGSPHQKDYPVTPSRHLSYHGEYLTNRMLIYAEEADHIAIEGQGTIDGNGADFVDIDSLEALKERPRIIHFVACSHIKVTDVTLRNSASWVQNYTTCSNLSIEGITVDSRENPDIEKPRFADAAGRNTDGIDIVDCSNVCISNCFIRSGDDGICLKSLSQKERCRNIVITNCIISTNASGIKIGTETVGGFHDIAISNCSIYDCRLGGIDVMCVDGAQIERVLVSNITLRNIKGTALFVRLGERNRMHRKDEIPGLGCVSDVLFQNIYGTGINRFGCSITGTPTTKIKNITFDNINLAFEGGKGPLWYQGEVGNAVAEPTLHNVPEVVGKHPRGDMFGKLPAFAFMYDTLTAFLSARYELLPIKPKAALQ